MADQPATQSIRAVGVNGKGDPLTWVACTASRPDVPGKCSLHVYLQTRGEVAERLKAAVC